MKRVLITSFLLSLPSLAVLADVPEPRPAFTRVKGIVLRGECNAPSGLGVLELEQRVGDVIQVRHIRVNSKQLCGSSTREDSWLTRITLDLVLHGRASLFEVTLKNGFAWKLNRLADADLADFERGATAVRHVKRHETMSWFYNGPSNITFLENETTVDEWVARYTTGSSP